MEQIVINGFVAFFVITWLSIIGLTLLIFVIIEIILSKMEIDKYYEKAKERELRQKFQDKLEIVKSQHTSEILECLVEMESLDEIYREIEANNYNFMSGNEYLDMKKEILDTIIKDKIETVKRSKTKKKSLIGELEECRERYPQYNEIFIENKEIITNK